MFSTNKDVKVMLNGQELEVRNLEVTYDMGDLPSVSIQGYLNPSRDYSGTLTVEYEEGAEEAIRKMVDEANRPFEGVDMAEPGGDRSNIEFWWGDKRVTNIKTIEAFASEQEKEMAYQDEGKACEDSSWGARNLAKKYVNLGLDNRQKLIRKYDLVQEDGTLTARGRELLLTILFDTYEDEVVEALEALEAEKPAPSGCGC